MRNTFQKKCEFIHTHSKRPMGHIALVKKYSQIYQCYIPIPMIMVKPRDRWLV